MNDESLDKMSKRCKYTSISNSEEELFNLRNKFSKDLKEVLSAKKLSNQKSRRGFQS
jgi:hypothetical protein